MAIKNFSNVSKYFIDLDLSKLERYYSNNKYYGIPGTLLTIDDPINLCTQNPSTFETLVINQNKGRKPNQKFKSDKVTNRISRRITIRKFLVGD